MESVKGFIKKLLTEPLSQAFLLISSNYSFQHGSGNYVLTLSVIYCAALKFLTVTQPAVTCSKLTTVTT